MASALVTEAVLQDRDTVAITWQDGLTSRFHAIWLRDNARGADARHQDNDQRLFDITELPEDLGLEAVTSDDQSLTVTFAADGYRAEFPQSWLRDYAYDLSAPGGNTRTLWGADIAGDLPMSHYEAVIQDDQARRLWLSQVDDFGFSILSGVPREEGMVCKVAEIFGFVRETNYGRLFEVRAEEKPVNLAYTGLGLNVHTDNPYRDPVPGLQLLHCLLANEGGGETVLVDGFKVAETLREEAPEDFDMLSRHWVPFRFRDDTADLQSRAPLIELDDRGRLVAVRYNNRSAAPFDLPADVMPRYYAAFRRFAAMLHRPEFELGFKLGNGQLMIFNNRRVLHGRKGFGEGKRHLQGCYADLDALTSELRKLEERKDG